LRKVTGIDRTDKPSKNGSILNSLDLIAEIILISSLGVLSPGPLFFANLIYGSKSGFRAGFKIALGHTIVEFPLIVLIAFGLSEFSSPFLTHESLRPIGLLGGTAIIFFSISQMIEILRTRRKNVSNNIDRLDSNSHFLYKWNKRLVSLKGPLVIGIIFSSLNPFFIGWWLTVGLKLISDSIALFGTILGAVFLFSFHIWMDYVWLGATSYMMHKGRSILQTKFFQLFLLSISLMLAFFGFYIIIINLS
jgi:threonine/homoserine/homoserine lactone efflux protein